jgi:hypothetical protein
MAENQNAGCYDLVWEKKPLGFSIVMDTTGANAYVSSIQKETNVKKGLKLAAQIVAVNGQNCREQKHSHILGLIKNASCPITLKFQPRSFANGPNSSGSNKEKAADAAPPFLKFGGADSERVNGDFELKKKEDWINGRPVWIRKDRLPEGDPVICWFWKKGSNYKVNGNAIPEEFKEGLWTLSRESHVGNGSTYACVDKDVKYPSLISSDEKSKNFGVWKVWSKTGGKEAKGGFVDTHIKISQTALDFS